MDRIFASSLLLLYFFGTAVAEKGVLLESRAIPRDFVHDGAAPPNATLNLRAALSQTNISGLHNVLMNVSTPSSSNYGIHLSKEQAEAFVKPRPESTSTVMQFFSSNGINATTLSPTGDWLGFTITVQRANTLFNANFSMFTHRGTGVQVIRTLSYTIPIPLQGHIELIHPTTLFPKPSSKLPVVASPIKPAIDVTSLHTLSTVPASCATVVTPSCLQALYGIPSSRATQTVNQLAVSAFEQQYVSESDLQMFLTDYRSDLSPNTTYILETIDGGTNPQGSNDASLEGNLDIEYTIGLATGVPVLYISVGLQNSDDIGGYLDIINFLLSQNTPPQVITTSYGFNEEDISITLANNLCNAYAQLGARGTSILFASGDGGVSGAQPGDCTTFLPTFPSVCPFLTSVGATTGINPETAASLSSGGFSNFFGRPAYQTVVVEKYLDILGSTNAGLFNASGRAFPDVSSQGQNVEIVWEGMSLPVDGTSCASPIFASIISLLNDELIAAGKSPLGFLNPFLYSIGASAFTDITSGNNPGCSTNGFPAVAGWDAITGLGTPNFVKLKEAVGL